MARSRRTTGSTLEEVTKNGGGSGENPEDGGAGSGPSSAAGVTRELPGEKSTPSGDLEDKMFFIYGPPKIGKSTLASEFGDYLFFQCEPGLKDLEVFKTDPITSWREFLEWAAAYAANHSQYSGAVIDTIDALELYCSEYTNARLGISHESDAEYGKGWDFKRRELARALSKLANLGKGLIVIGHSKDVDVKKKNDTYTRSVPRAGKAAREIVSDMADLILFCDVEYNTDGTEVRVIRTKPSKSWEAGERGNKPRLPETIDWPLGQGFQVLKDAWYAEEE